MPDLILYHYDLSPFSEKIRLMLGYTGLSWCSVKVAEMPPRTGLDILAGGYRRIPVAQIGADVFCDTKTIVAEIVGLAGKPQLAVENCDSAVQDFVQHAELDVFLAISLTPGKNFVAALIRETSLITTLRVTIQLPKLCCNNG